MPARRTIDDWRKKDPDFHAEVARAREIGNEVLAEDCLNIADDNGNDIRYTDKGDAVVDGDVIQRAKLRVETRLKLLACWDPRRYGNKVGVEHSGNVGLGQALDAAIERVRQAREVSGEAE